MVATECASDKRLIKAYGGSLKIEKEPNQVATVNVHPSQEHVVNHVSIHLSAK